MVILDFAPQRAQNPWLPCHPITALAEAASSASRGEICDITARSGGIAPQMRRTVQPGAAKRHSFSQFHLPAPDMVPQKLHHLARMATPAYIGHREVGAGKCLANLVRSGSPARL